MDCNPEALEALPEVRRLLVEGKNNEAKSLAKRKMMGSPYKIKSYQTLGDLFLQAIKDGALDPQLETLYFQFGRYLLTY